MKETTDNVRKTVDEIVNVMHEHLIVHREIVETGKVNIHKHVTQEQVTVDIPIFNESYQIEHHPGSDTILDEPPLAVRHEGETMIIPVLKEITVIQKKYQVVEEIYITRNITTTPLTQEVTLRKEAVTIDRK